MKKLITFTLFFFYFFIYSQNNEWVLININDGEGTEYYFKKNNYNTVWVKAVSEKTIYYPDNNIRNKKIVNGYNIILYKFNCSEKKIGIIQIDTYSKSGKVLKIHSNVNDYPEMDYVVPDSIGEGLLNAFCGWEDYAIDIELKQLYEQYKSKGNSETFEQFIDAKNQMGDSEFYNFINSQINPSGELKKNKKQ